ncbi:hypothetical protein [Pantoea ananatis]|uniref:hypothetical protein n=1 Tax=Pantoea ananas TaxID=553 RepID=UPI001B306D36|nr:hypothetical protein [Pantoea ananatis]
MRIIYLPELIRIKISNYTLYPAGLNFEYDFINGVNLVLGGNGMGKTTFVNLIKYALIGPYKKQFDYTRTYKDRMITKRLMYAIDYFKNRMDDSILVNEEPNVELTFKINNDTFKVVRSLNVLGLNEVYINNKILKGKIANQSKYEALGINDREGYLSFNYEKEIEKSSGLSFDDLILFVNEILYFGEDHKTILWNNGESGIDVQNELFNKYFNSPNLDKERQEAARQAKYYDSISRHRSEDIRAIKKVLDKVDNNKIDNSKINNPYKDMINLKNEIDFLENKLKNIRELNLETANKASFYQNKINTLSLTANELEKKINETESTLNSKIWQNLHPLYHLFVENIKKNSICPLCNLHNNQLNEKVVNDSTHCFSCGSEFSKVNDDQLSETLTKLLEEYKSCTNEIQENQKKIKESDKLSISNDKEVRHIEAILRKNNQNLRSLELSVSDNNKENKTNELQAFYDEINRLEFEKNKYQDLSRTYSSKAEKISKEIESQILNSTAKFSTIFSEYAGDFLGVKCSLTFEKMTSSSIRRFYPMIDDKVRFYEEELSESQRFFIDHSFRMSILTYFYSSPTFYIVETPDSSLDISYEQNAANVFLRFLEKPNSIIMTSNLNNSSFIYHLIDNVTEIKIKLVKLLEIAKRSSIQNTNITLMKLYEEIKNKVSKIC